MALGLRVKPTTGLLAKTPRKRDRQRAIGFREGQCITRYDRDRRIRLPMVHFRLPGEQRGHARA